jgi:cysteine-rich repeat protein
MIHSRCAYLVVPIVLCACCSTSLVKRTVKSGQVQASPSSGPSSSGDNPTRTVAKLVTAGTSPRPSQTAITQAPIPCGNGNIDAAEECDDGNTSAGDGCNSNCRAEAVQIAGGGGHFCIITSVGSVKCWGSNDYGELGYGDTKPRGTSADSIGSALQPIDLGVGRRAISLALGTVFSCALLDDDSVKCWGHGEGLWYSKNGNDHRGDAPGEMGDALPVFPVPPKRRIVHLTAESVNACITFDDGSYTCWGNRELERTKNVPLGGKVRFVEPAYIHSCALLQNGQVRCWGGACIGTNRDLPLDQPQTIRFSSTQKVKQLALGRNHTCALLEDGGVTCWGDGVFGQLGRVPTPNDCRKEADNPVDGPALCAFRPSPKPLDLGGKALAIDIGPQGLFTCALIDNGSVRCWGENNYGQLGIGQVTEKRYNMFETPPEPNTTVPAHPVNLGEGKKAKAIAVGGGGACALLTDGCVKCWGFNKQGQLGYGDTVDRSAPPETCVDY